MEEGDRNTILTIVLVLVVSVVALFALIGFTWQFVAEPVTNFFETAMGVSRVNRIDYRFPITLAEEEIEDNSENVRTTAKNIISLAVRFSDEQFNYQFRPPRIEYDENLVGIQSAIVNDAIRAGYATSRPEDAQGQAQLQLKIPSIGIDSPVWQGTDANGYLEKGFWLYPFSGDLGDGENVLLCHRRYFGPNDPRSCWFLDKLQNGDTLTLNFADEIDLHYEVSEIRVYDAEDPEIYNIDDNRDALRIVTCTPLYSDEQRLVVIADRVTSSDNDFV